MYGACEEAEEPAGLTGCELGPCAGDGDVYCWWCHIGSGLKRSRRMSLFCCGRGWGCIDGLFLNDAMRGRCRGCHGRCLCIVRLRELFCCQGVVSWMRRLPCVCLV